MWRIFSEAEFEIFFFQPEFGSDSDSPASCANSDIATTSKDAAARLFFQILHWSKSLIPFVCLSPDDQVREDARQASVYSTICTKLVDSCCMK